MPNNMRRALGAYAPSRQLLLLLLLAPAALAIGLAFIATARGPGLTPDSAYYIAAARSLVHGHGLRTMGGAPLTHYPPGYPAVLAIPALVGSGPLRAARWTDAILFAALVALVALIAWRASDSLGAAVVASLLVLTAAGIDTFSARVLSGPLAVLLALGALAVLDRWPVRSALLMAASMLTRYAMGAFWLAGVVVLLRRRQVREASRWSLVAWLPVIAWLLRNELVAHSATHRALAWHPPPFHDVRMGLGTLAAWLMLRPWTYALSLPIAIGALAVLAIIAYRERTSLRGTLATAALTYLACLWLARSVADAMIPFDARLLAPAAICIAIIAATFLGQYAPRARWLWLVAGIAVAAQATGAIAWARAADRDGLGYNATRWRQSETVARLPAQGPLYTNWIAVPYFLAGRVAREIPRRYNAWSGRATPHYGDSLAVLAKSGGSVVYFDTDPTPPFFPTASALGAHLPLVLIDSSADGRIYRIGSRR